MKLYSVKTFGWNPVKLANHSMSDLMILMREVEARHPNPYGGLYLYSPTGRTKLDAISWAVPLGRHMNITPLEAKILINIAENELSPGNGAVPATHKDAGSTWANCLGIGPEEIEARSIPGVVASLSKKGLAWCSGKGKEAEVGLTQAGFDAYQKVKADGK